MAQTVGHPFKLLPRGESAGMLLAIPDGSHGRFPPWAAPRAAQTLHPSQPFPPGSADITGVQLQRAGLCLVRESTLCDLATFITLLHPSKHSQDRAVWHVPKGSLLWQVPVALGHFLGCSQPVSKQGLAVL